MRLRPIISVGTLFLFFTTLASTGFFHSGYASEKKKIAQEPVKLRIVPFGPTQVELDAASVVVTRHADVQKFLQGAKFRLLNMEMLDNDVKGQPSRPPTRFRANFYDYTNSRVITAEGEINNLARLQVTESFYQPMPSDEEFEIAVQTLKND